MWVSPFRNLRIIGYLLLPVAYRSLSRLSSALSAKASTLRSSSLNQIYLDLRVRVRYLTCIALHALIGCVYICKPRCLSWHYRKGHNLLIRVHRCFASISSDLLVKYTRKSLHLYLPYLWNASIPRFVKHICTNSRLCFTRYFSIFDFQGTKNYNDFCG